MPFPKPIRLGGNCTRWALSDLERYEAEATGRHYKPRSTESEIYFSDINLAERYNVSRNTVWRWARGDQEVQS